MNARGLGGLTPLDCALSKGDKETADLLRKHGGKAKAPDINFHRAVFDGNIKAVKQHLAAGTYVDSESITGWTPLYFAAQAGYKEIVELLLAKGADVNAKTATGDTPLDHARAFKQTEITDLLRKHGGKTGAELKAEGK